jgi:hypothetical protein
VRKTDGTGPGLSVRNRAENLTLTRKIVLTLLTGSLTFIFSAILDGPLDVPLSQQIVLSTLIGGLTLLVQFLFDFEKRIGELEEEQNKCLTAIRTSVVDCFSRISEATSLMSSIDGAVLSTESLTGVLRSASAVSDRSHPLVLDLAHAEIERVALLLRSLGEGKEIFYDGEDREWLLGLTKNVRSTIDATSLATVDAGSANFEGGLWMNDLGGRYLDLQRVASDRGVRIRRIFVFDDLPDIDPEDFHQICVSQRAAGVEVRELESTMVPLNLKNLIFDFVVFDGAISYETTPATRMDTEGRPAIVTTRLVLDIERVRGRSRRFESLWEVAQPVEVPQRSSPVRSPHVPGIRSAGQGGSESERPTKA